MGTVTYLSGYRSTAPVMYVTLPSTVIGNGDTFTINGGTVQINGSTT